MLSDNSEFSFNERSFHKKHTFNFLGWIKLPWNLKFEILIKCVGGVKSCRSTASHLSWSISNRFIQISRSHTSKPGLQAVKTFFPISNLYDFFKCSRIPKSLKICQEAYFDLLYNLSKKHLGVKKKTHSLFSGHFYQKESFWNGYCTGKGEKWTLKKEWTRNF